VWTANCSFGLGSGVSTFIPGIIPDNAAPVDGQDEFTVTYLKQQETIASL
jgi:hypothetical protein